MEAAEAATGTEVVTQVQGYNLIMSDKSATGYRGVRQQPGCETFECAAGWRS